MAPEEKPLPAEPDKRHRTTPILSSITPVPNYPAKLVIYQIAASSYWWVRYYVDKKIARRSTKTSDKRKAFAFAKEFYDEINYKRRQGLSISSHSNFELCANDVMEAQKSRVARGDVTKMFHQSDGYRLKSHILPFFREYDVGQIDYFVLEKFLTVLSEQKLAPPTVADYFVLIRKILNYAVKRGFISSLPHFPKIGKQDQPRGWFTTRDYRKLWNAARRLRGKTYELRQLTEENKTKTLVCEAGKVSNGKLLRRINISDDIYQLIVFMTNSFIRPTDIKFIQHKHIEVIEGEYTYLRLSIPTTKKHSKPIVTMAKAVDVYKRLKASHTQHGQAGPDNYIFLPEQTDRVYALRLLARQFDVILEETKLKLGPNNEKRTLYSLRHTCIMFRLLYGQGLDLLTLARNARTSPEMIDRFYASHLNAEMNIGMIQSRRFKNRSNTSRNEPAETSPQKIQKD